MIGGCRAPVLRQMACSVGERTLGRGAGTGALLEGFPACPGVPWCVVFLRRADDDQVAAVGGWRTPAPGRAR